MLYLTCTTITSIDLAHYRVSRAKDWVSVKCGTNSDNYLYTNKVLKVLYVVHVFSQLFQKRGNSVTFY